MNNNPHCRVVRTRSLPQGTNVIRNRYVRAFFLAAVLSLPISAAGGVSRHSVDAPVDELRILRTGEGDIVELSGWTHTTEPGFPALPCRDLVAALPEDAVNAAVSVESVVSRDVAGSFNPVPVKFPEPLDRSDADLISASDRSDRSDRSGWSARKLAAEYPGTVIETVAEWDLAGQRFLTLRFYPVQYDPALARIRIVESVEFEILWSDGEAEALRPCNFTGRARRLYESMLSKAVINPDAVCLPPYPGGEENGSLSSGCYEHVIVTPDHLASAWDELVAWHLKKGVPDTVIVTSWIDTAYSGTPQEKLRGFISDAHVHWGTAWVLLGGDAGLLPCNTVSFAGKYVSTDGSYSDIDDDWISEVFVGRAPVETMGEAALFAGKVLDYEKNPPADFGATALLLGFDVDQATFAENMMSDFHNENLPWFFGVAEVFDSDPGSHRMEALAVLEAGPNFVNHADHGSPFAIGAGRLNHGTHIYISDIRSLSNGGRLGNMFSLSPFSNSFQMDDCFGEEYLLAENGGGVSFIGSSHTGWYIPGSTNAYSFLLDREYMSSVFADECRNLGLALATSKNSFYPSDDYYKLTWSAMNLLGEPEMEQWLADPADALVCYFDTIPPAPQDFAVRVFKGGTPVEEALVCARSLEEGIYLQELTDGHGAAFFQIAPEMDALEVTVSGQDLLPYEGEAAVADITVLRKGPYLLYPGESSGMSVRWQLDETASCTLEWGRDASYSDGSASTEEENAENHLHSFTFEGLTSGERYFYRVTVGGSGADFTGSFRAAPGEGDGGARLFCYGDTRTCPEVHDIVAVGILDAIAAAPDEPGLLLHCGDWTSSDTESDWDTEHFDARAANVRRLNSNFPVNGGRGNHDGMGTNYAKYWPYPYVNDFYWSFDFGPVHIAVVDQYAPYDFDSAQYAWLADDLASSTKPWKVMMYHEPAWSAGGGHPNNEEAQEYLHPLCVAHDVRVVIAGHNHYYARCEVDGVQYVTTAGGGAPLYGCDPFSPYLVSCARAYHYCELEFDGPRLDMRAVDIAGSVIDSFTVIRAQPDTDPPLPDPMEWEVEPYPSAPDSVTMTAVPAYDTSGVEYYFECVSGAGHHSGWQESPSYTDSALEPYTEYGYRVKARDRSPQQNETGFSETGVAVTHDAVTIIHAEYREFWRQLIVRATSSAQPEVTLTLVDIGEMAWKSSKNYYEFKRRVGECPPSVTVMSSAGGSDFTENID